MKYWKNGFYLTQIEDSVEITDEYWQELLDGQSQGKQIVSNEDGYPILADPPAPTIEELAQGARAKRDALITEVQWRKDRHYDEVALGLEPTESIQPILEYIQALREVPQQEGFPVNVAWPTPPWEEEVING